MSGKITIHIPNLAHVNDKKKPRRQQRRQWRETEEAAAVRQTRQQQRQGQHQEDEAAGPVSAEQARDRFTQEFIEFLQVSGPVAYAFGGDFGLGKTTIAAAEIAKADDTAVVFVPTLRLADEIRDKHLPQAKVFRGREAKVPGDPKRTMCDDLDAVADAYEAGLSVTEACCHRTSADGRELRCPFFDSCAYWRQKDDTVKIWIAAHQMMFLDQGIFTMLPARVIIDEDFWQAGLDPPTEHGIRSGLGVHDIIDDHTPRHLQAARQRLAQALRRQQGFGGVERKCFGGLLTVEQCNAAISAEWRHIGNQTETAQWPGMSEEERAAAREQREQITHDRQVVRILETVATCCSSPRARCRDGC